MRVINDKWAWHKNAVSPANHPPLMNPGEGLSKMSEASNKEKQLKLAAHRAAAALKEYQIATSGKSPKKAK